MKPKVSVIIPIYNVESYLDRCIQSVLNQTLKDIEIILVDDGSPDNCPAMCDEYARQDNRIKVIHKKNAGLGYARNSGLEIVTGEYVAFLDSDDFVDVNMYQKLYETAKQGDFDTVFCNCFLYANESNKKIRKDVKKQITFKGRDEVDDFLLDIVGPKPAYPHDVKYLMSVWHAIYAMDIIRRKKLRFVSERDFISEDIIWDIDYLHEAVHVCFLPDAFYYYCVNNVSLSRVYNPVRYEKNKILLTEVCKRLSLIFEKERYEIHYLRFMFLFLRTSLSRACVYSKSNKEIVKILNDVFWKDLLNNYPFYRMRLKHIIFFILLKMKSVFIIRLLFK